MPLKTLLFSFSFGCMYTTCQSAHKLNLYTTTTRTRTVVHHLLSTFGDLHQNHPHIQTHIFKISLFPFPFLFYNTHPSHTQFTSITSHIINSTEFHYISPQSPLATLSYVTCASLSLPPLKRPLPSPSSICPPN